jgi:hypothetical protein
LTRLVTGFVNNLNYTPLKTQTKTCSWTVIECISWAAIIRLDFVTQTHKKRSGNILRSYSFTFIFHLCITIWSQKELYTLILTTNAGVTELKISNYTWNIQAELRTQPCIEVKNLIQRYKLAFVKCVIKRNKMLLIYDSWRCRIILEYVYILGWYRGIILNLQIILPYKTLIKDGEKTKNYQKFYTSLKFCEMFYSLS